MGELNHWLPILVDAWRTLRTGGKTSSADRSPGGGVSPVELSSDERRDIVAGAARLSRGLTGERALAGARYFEDPQLLGAYLLLYWPVSYAQARAVFDEIGGASGAVLDVGSGPGPMALAALDAGAATARAVDRIPAALAVARSLAIAAGTSLAIESWEPGRPLSGGAYDLVIAGHLLNELFGDDIDRRLNLVMDLLGRVRPDGYLVLVEPALRETSRALLEVRDRVVVRGVSVRAPCLFRGPCPALVRVGDWCHADHRWSPPPLIAELAEAAHLHRDALKMTYLVLQPTPTPWAEPPAGRVFRIVSEPLPEKGKHRFVGCGPEGRFPLVLADKHLRDGNRSFVALERGDIVRVDRLTMKGDGLRLDDQSVVERLERR
jgi:SAM-dependent methyltransferase